MGDIFEDRLEGLRKHLKDSKKNRGWPTGQSPKERGFGRIRGFFFVALCSWEVWERYSRAILDKARENT